MSTLSDRERSVREVIAFIDQNWMVMTQLAAVIGLLWILWASWIFH